MNDPIGDLVAELCKGFAFVLEELADRMDEDKDDGLQFLNETEADLWADVYRGQVDDEMFPELAADRAVKAYRMRVPLFTKEYVQPEGEDHYAQALAANPLTDEQKREAFEASREQRTEFSDDSGGSTGGSYKLGSGEYTETKGGPTG